MNMYPLPPPTHPSGTQWGDLGSEVIGNGCYCLRVARCRQGGYVADTAGSTGRGAADSKPTQGLHRSRPQGNH